VAEFCCLLVTADRHTVFWKWEESQTKLLSEAHSETAPNTFRSAWCDINTFKPRTVCALISPTDQNLFKFIQFFPLGQLGKTISGYQWPHKGTIFRSAISVTVLNILYMCLVFGSDSVLFFFHSDAQLFCFFYFSASYFFSLWSNL